MTAQETILNYVSGHNDTDIDNKQLVVQMMTDGMVISQLPKVVAHAKRIGKEIIVTETTYSQTHEVVNGKLIDTDHESTVEVIRVSI